MTETDIETIDTRTAHFGALLLRTALGAMYIAHGLVLKVMTFTLPGTEKFLPLWACRNSPATQFRLSKSPAA